MIEHSSRLGPLGLYSAVENGNRFIGFSIALPWHTAIVLIDPRFPWPIDAVALERTT
jgi:hypothetical protein